MRRAYAVAYARRNVEEMRGLFADDFEWHQRAEWPGRSVYRIDDLPALWDELDATYPEFDLEPVDFIDSNECVVVEVHTSARMPASGDRIDGRIWHVWRLGDGIVREVHVFSDREEAFETTR